MTWETRPPEETASRKKTPRSRDPLNENALYEYAVKALGRRMRTAAELKRLMHGKVEPNESGESKITAVLARLQEYGYLNDASFASTYTRLRQENEGFGRRRVQLDLSRKGIARDLIASTLEAAYQDTSEEDLARRYLAKKRIGKPQNQKETARIVRRLTAAGFSISAISRILKNWEVAFNEEALEPLEDGSEP
jgi:regulatory protein